MATTLMLDHTPADNLHQIIDLLLHEVRTPLGVAQGYLRLLLEDRLADAGDRHRALEQSLAALAEVGAFCTSASEYLDPVSPLGIVTYPAAHLVAMLVDDWQARPFALRVHGAPVVGHIRSLPPQKATALFTTILEAALRSAPSLARAVHVGVHGSDLILTTGDEAVRERLLTLVEHAAFNQWRGGTGLLVPLAVRQLAQTRLRIWTLPDASGALAVALPLEALP